MDRPLPRLPRARLTHDRATLVEILGIRHHGPGSARSVRGALDELAARPRPDRGRARARRHRRPRRRRRTWCRRWPGWSTPSTSLGGRSSTRWPCSRPSGSRCGGPSSTASPVRFADLPATSSAGRAGSCRGSAGADAGSSRPDRHPRCRRRLRRPRALVGGRDRAPSARLDLARFAVLREAMAATSVADEPGPTTPENDPREAAMRRVIRAAQTVPAASASRSCAAPATRPRCILSPGRPPPLTTSSSTGCPRPRSRRPGCRGPRAASPSRAATAPASRSPGWYQHLFVTAPSETVVAAAGWSRSPAPCAASSSTPRRPRSSRPSGWPTPWPRVRGSALRRPRGARRRHAGRAVRRLRRCRCDSSTDAHRRRGARDGARLHADGAAGQRPRSASRSRCASSRRASQTVIQLDLRKEAQLARSVLLHRLRAARDRLGRADRRRPHAPARSRRPGSSSGGPSSPSP